MYYNVLYFSVCKQLYKIKIKKNSLICTFSPHSNCKPIFSLELTGAKCDTSICGVGCTNADRQTDRPGYVNSL